MKAKSGGWKWGRTGPVFKTKREAEAYGRRQKSRSKRG